MNVVLSIDVGTTTIGVGALDVGSNELLCARSVPNTTTVPGLPPHHHEQDPRKILKIVKGLLFRVAADVCEGFSRNRSIRGIVVTGQMHGIVLVDAKNRPRCHLITWRDQRATRSSNVQYLAADMETAKRCGCRIQPGYGFAILHHLISDDAGFASELLSGDVRVCGIADYVVANLCDLLVTDLTMAASWGGLALRSGDWDSGTLEALEIPESALPPLRKSAEPIASISSFQAIELGIDSDAMVCSGIGDHQSSIAGCRPIGDRSCVLNVGTGGQVSLVTTEPESFNNLETRPFTDGYFLITGASLCGGWSYQYLADFFRSILHEFTDKEFDRDSIFAVMNRLGEHAPADANGLVVDPVFLGSRHSRQVTGSIVGVDAVNMEPSNLVRATANGIINELFGYFELMQRPAGRLHAVGNAIRQNPLLVPAIAEQWKIDPIVASRREAAAYGAACLAAVHLGLADLGWVID